MKKIKINSPIHELIAETGAAATLNYLVAQSETSYRRIQIEDIFVDHGSQQPDILVDRFLESNLLEVYGNQVGISHTGRKVVLLIEAMNGGDIKDIIRKLRGLEGIADRYELVRQDMTKSFIRTLSTNPRIGRLYICSPWINPSPNDAATIRYAVMQSRKTTGRSPEILVITRPPHGSTTYTNGGLQAFIDVGASIHYHPRIHTKLYMREPDSNGGILLAVVGSENLTRSNLIELGIRINGDTLLINQLIRYFYDTMNICKDEL